MLTIISALCFLAGTTALSAGLFSLLVAKEYYYNKKPKFIYRFFGFLFGITNKFEAIRQFEGGSWEEIKRNFDATAPMRGFIWYLMGTIFVILSALL
ncbi:hypothetical protein A2767_03360 [Candidatus Roizmanbacteria bacterium RIFCSPHIGHO2_01_FULL_35_10]|nr:MAG: hypothetical protein A2767_03360 [Candidatus Roizmanbacteria bacterium RIFCSPHIGHO2_01_FULL_35_10]